MNRRNIDGGHIRLTVLRGVPRGAYRSRWTVPILSVVTFLVVIGAIALYWVEVFGPIFKKPAPKQTESVLMQRARVMGEKARVEAEIGEPGPVQLAILGAARLEVERGVRYSDKYYTLTYPGGDVPAEVGASTDIVIRALRAVGLDLQQAIHEDRKANPSRYPSHRWKSRSLDPSIDHRRVANLFAWLQEHAQSVTTKTDAESLRRFHAGDILMWGADSNRFPVHVGVVSDRRNDAGVPYVIDLNRRDGTATETHLATDWYVRAHFRITEVPASSEAAVAATPDAAAAPDASPTRPGGAGSPNAAAPQPAK